MKSSVEKQLPHPDVWSNIFFVVPIVAALYVGLLPFAFVLTATGAVSFFFHLSGEKQFRLLDVIFAYIAIIWSALLAWRGDLVPKGLTYAASGFAALALFFFYSTEDGRREINHSIWHFCAATIIFFCILIFAL